MNLRCAFFLILALQATPSVAWAPSPPPEPGGTTGGSTGGTSGPGPMGSPSVPELGTGSLGSGALVLLGAALVFVDYRRRRLQEAPASRRNDEDGPK